MKRHVLAACLLSLAAATSLGGALAATGGIVYRANPQVFEDSGIAAPGSQVPVKLVLPSKAGVLVNAGDVLSAPSVATGPDAGFLLVARGGELRACSSADCSSGGSFASSVRATNGGTVQARLAGPTTVGGVNRMTVESGSYTGTFEVSATSDAGLEPVADVVNAEPGSLQVSTVSTLKGFASTTLSVTGGEYRLNGGAWTTSASTAKAGDKVELRVATGAFGTSKIATVSVAGGSPISFTSSARGQDTLPDVFAVAAVADAAPSAQVVSAAVTPTGFDGTLPISATGGEVSVAGGAYAASATIALGQSFTVRTTSSATFGATASAQVTVGTGSAVPFQVTTRAQDTTPDAFAITPVAGVEPSTLVQSAAVTPTGYEGSVAISAVDGDVSVAGGAYAASSTISPGQAFTVRRTSSASFGGTAIAQVRVGSSPAAEFRVTTRAQDTLPDAFVVAGVTKAEPSTVTTSAAVTPAGFEGTVPITVTGGTVSVAGGAYAASGTIASGQSFTVRATSSASYADTVTAGVTVGTGAAVPFTVKTRADVVLAASSLAGTVGSAYSLDFKTLTTAQGVATSALSYASADKPSWMTLSAAGVASGTPTAAGSASFTVVASHADGSGQRTYTINVGGATVNVASLAVGYNHTCAITSAGGLKCWGGNSYGQLGDGTSADKLGPVDVQGLTSGVTAVAAGTFVTCALLSTGAVKCWGNNESGGIGDGTTTKRLVPTQVSGLTSGVTSIGTGYQTSCALSSAGGVKCWGYNSEGEVGDGTTAVKTTPVNVSGLTSGVASMSVGEFNTCVVTTSGAAKCWGYGDYGAVGNGAANAVNSSPVQVSGLTSGVASVEVGTSFACVLTTSGGAKCWGSNGYGQLGNNTKANSSTPVDVIGLTSGGAALSAGSYTTCALTTGGGAKCWGNNGYGQLGNAGATPLVPTDVTGMTSGVRTVSTMGYHACGITTAGAMRCWGYNASGQIGDGTTTNRPTPVAVAGSF